MLFPEGTTSNGRFMLSFQNGAFVPGYPVQPVVVRYPYVHFDQSWYSLSASSTSHTHKPSDITTGIQVL